MYIMDPKTEHIQILDHGKSSSSQMVRILNGRYSYVLLRSPVFQWLGPDVSE